MSLVRGVKSYMKLGGWACSLWDLEVRAVVGPSVVKCPGQAGVPWAGMENGLHVPRRR